MKKYSGLLLLLVFATNVYSEKTVTICGSATYYMPETQTLEGAKRTAIMRARLQALADEFGTNVAQTNTTTMHSEDGKTQTFFNSYSENDVRGIWLEDTKEPELTIRYKDETAVIQASVCGKAREIKNNPIELLIEPLNYGQPHGEEHPKSPGHATTEFHDGDFFGVHFKSPVSGYVAIFWRDDNADIVYTQLPYANSDGYSSEVKSNRDYIFLSNEDPNYPYKSTTILEAKRKIEYNTLIVVFSQKRFHVSLSNQGEFFPEIEVPKFQKWIHSLRIYDETAQIQETVITISK